VAEQADAPDSKSAGLTLGEGSDHETTVILSCLLAGE